MDDQELLRRAAEYGQGVGGKPTIRQITIRDAEVIDMPKTQPNLTVYLQPPIPYPSLSEPPNPDEIIHPETREFISAEHATRIWVDEYSTLDTTDILHPVITSYGHERIYRVRVWMPVEEYYTKFPPDEDDDDNHE